MTFTGRSNLRQRTLSATIHYRRKRLWVAEAVSLLWLAPVASGQTPFSSTVNDLLKSDACTFVKELRAVRPVSSEMKARVLESLPKKGEVIGLGKSTRRKVASLDRVLRVYQRDSVYEIKVVAVRQAFVGLYERAVLVVSEPALALLSVGELQAMAAHEMGHDFASDRYRRAARSQPRGELRSTELFCDAVAAVTLIEVGLDVDGLITGLEKMARFNDQFGAALNEDSYPSLSERKRFAKRVAAWALSTPQPYCRAAADPTNGENNEAQ
jgi:hypothetical protein